MYVYERRLKNAVEFRKVINPQRASNENVCAKRCVELSPSVEKPSAKVHAAGTSCRRSIDFTLADETRSESSVSIKFNRYDIAFFLFPESFDVLITLNILRNEKNTYFMIVNALKKSFMLTETFRNM